MQKLYSCEIIADSVSDREIRLTTLTITLPRFVLAELNTHRMFSRNSASSRAIPVERRIEMVENDPVVPISFGRNQKGMVAAGDLEGEQAEEAQRVWLAAKDSAIRHARHLAHIDVHKQIANRLIEPWAPTTVLITATEWDNFFALRISPNAQPEIRKAAESMKAAMDASVPMEMRVAADGWNAPDWHLPYERGQDGDADWLTENAGFGDVEEMTRKICIGRCARVSYLTQDGKRDPLADIVLCDRLLKNGHMSPFEHVARPMTEAEWYIYASPDLMQEKANPKAFCGNFNGWIQYRKLIHGEAVYTGE